MVLKLKARLSEGDAEAEATPQPPWYVQPCSLESALISSLSLAV